jgi:beta-lactamase regulating signal transducer with metallopeptidase domain
LQMTAALMISLVVKGTLLFALAFILDHSLRRRLVLLASAVWNAVLVGLLILPMATVLLQTVEVPLLPARPMSRSEAIPVGSSEIRGRELSNSHAIDKQMLTDVPGGGPLLPGSQTTENGELAFASPGTMWGSWAMKVLFLVYGAGVLAVIVRLLGSWRAVQTLLRDSREVTNAAWNERFDVWRRAFLGGPSVRLLETDEIDVPVALGVFRPAIVIPTRLVAEAKQSDIDTVLVHELAHMVRGDNAWLFVQRLAEAIWWYHPLVWLMRTRIAFVREQACDAFSVYAIGDTAAYVDSLVRIASAGTARRTLGLGLAVVPRTNIARRLEYVERTTGEKRCDASRTARLIITLGTLCATLLMAVLVIGRATAEPLISQEEPSTEEKQANGQPIAPASMSWTIVDGTTAKPIEGAKVTVEHMIVTPTGRTTLATTQHVTNADGKYTVDLPASEVAEPTLAIVPRATHPGYADLGAILYGYHHTRRNARAGVSTAFGTQRMYPGEEVTGIIQDPQARPVADLPIKAYSTWMKKKIPSSASIDRDEDDQSTGSLFVADESPVFSNTETRTNAQGRFRFIALKSGDVRFKVEPHDLAATTTLLGDKRGDIGIVRLEPGVPLVGRVVDVAGKPIADVWINVHRAERRQPLDATGDVTSRAAKTDANGNFALEPVLPGRYRLTVSSEDEGSSTSIGVAGRLPAAFDPVILDVPAEGLQPLEIRAIPHATVDVLFVDSAGKPFAGGDLIIEGRRGQRPFSRHLRSGEQGNVTTAVPRDLTQVRLYAMTSEENAYRVRRGRDGELKNDHQINLGKLDHDVGDLFFVRYGAPTLWFKMLNAEGKRPIPGERLGGAVRV